CPIGLALPNSWLTVSGPSTTTEAAFRWSASVMKRPASTGRDRTVRQLGVVPVSVVVQFVDPRTSDADVVDAGATASMSGAATREGGARASAWVSADAVPNPPRAPAVVVELPGETTSTFVPSSLI